MAAHGFSVTTPFQHPEVEQAAGSPGGQGNKPCTSVSFYRYAQLMVVYSTCIIYCNASGSINLTEDQGEMLNGASDHLDI